MLPTTTQLTTTNYRLRIPDESDFDFIFSATRYPGFNDGMLWEPPKSIEELYAPLTRQRAKWREGKAYQFTIERRDESAERLGRISIYQTEALATWGIGFWTHPAHQGRGVMTEALSALVDFGFQTLKAERLIAQYATWNVGSERVLFRNQFQLVGYQEKGFQKHGKWIAENEVQLTRTRWTKPS